MMTTQQRDLAGRAGIGPITISNVPVDRRRLVRRSRDGGKSKRSKIWKGPAARRFVFARFASFVETAFACGGLACRLAGTIRACLAEARAQRERRLDSNQQPPRL